MSARGNVRWVKPPAFLVAVAGLVGIIGIGMTIVGSQTTGVSTDEPGHVRRLNNYLASGLYVRGFELYQAPAGQIPVGAYVYGPVTSIIQHDFNRALDFEDLPKAKTRPHHYRVRHAVIAAMALAGLLAAAAMGWAILGSWRWAVVTAGILSAIPMWTGHAMFNMKDTPVAAGHTIITMSLVLLALSKPATKGLVMFLAAVGLTAGTTLMLGTRPGAWPSLLGSLIVFSVIAVRARHSFNRTHVLRLAAAVSGSMVVAYFWLRMYYPRVFGDLGHALYTSAFTSANYDGLGDQVPSDRTYLFAHALTDLPLGLVTLMATGTAVAAYLWLVQRRRSTRLDCIALVGSQAFALTTAAVVLDSDLYHGLRQMLFAMPALAVLAAIGLAALLTKFRTKPRAGLTVAVGACFALALPTAAQAQMFPYQYSYVNVASEQWGIFGVQPEYDYFGTSFHEFAYDGPQDVKVVCPFLRYGGPVERSDGDCRTRFGHTFSAYWRGRPTPDRPKGTEFYALLRGSRPTPPACRLYRAVERRQNLKTVVMSRMFLCQEPTPAQLLAGHEMRNRNRASAGHRPKPIPPELVEAVRGAENSAAN